MSSNTDSTSSPCYVYINKKLIGQVLKVNNRYYCYICGTDVKDSRTLGRHLRDQHYISDCSVKSTLSKGDEDGGKILNQNTEVQNIPKSKSSSKKASTRARRVAKRACIQDLRLSSDAGSEAVFAQSSVLDQMADIEMQDVEHESANASVIVPSASIDKPPESTQTTRSVENQLGSKDGLEEYGLYLYMDKAFHCPSCKCLLLPEEVVPHWRNNHSKGSALLVTCTKQYLEEKLEEYICRFRENHTLSQTREEFISLFPPPSARPPFEHFEVESGFQCPSCSFVQGSWRAMTNHTSQAHGGSEEKKKISIDCQRIWFTCLENQSRYVAVNKHMGQCQVSHNRSLLIEFSGTPWHSTPIAAAEINLGEMSLFQRQVTAFLNTLGYTNRVKEIPIQMLITAVQLSPLPAFFVKLRELCYQYVKLSQQRIEGIMAQSPFLLKKLENDGYVVDASQFPITYHLDNRALIKDKLRLFQKKTIINYSLFVARFLGFVLTILQNEEMVALLKICLTQYQKQAFSNLLLEFQKRSVPITATEWITPSDSGDPSPNDVFIMIDEDETWFEDNEDVDTLNCLSLPDLEPEIDNIQEENLDGSSPLMKVLHECILSCFKTNSVDEEATPLSLLPSYVVFLSVQPDGKFKSPIKQTPGNAKLKFLGKAAFLNELFYLALKDGRLFPMNKDFDVLSNWISRDAPVTTPYMWLSHVQSRLSHHALSDTGLSTIIWDSTGHKLMYEDWEISMADFDQFITSLHDEVHEKLSRLLLGIPMDRLAESISSYKDDVQSQHKHFNFLFDQQRYYTYPLYTRIRQDPTYFDQTSGKWLPNHDNISAYLQWAKDFVLCLFTAVYFTSGMPPRATELLAVLYRNRPSRIRDIFAIGPELALRSAYMKTNTLTESLGSTLRLFSPPIAKAVLVYLKDIVPIICFLIKQVYPSVYARGLGKGGTDHDHPYYTHLFAVDGAPLQAHSAYQYVKTKTAEHFGFPLGISDARHILKAIGRQYIPPLTISNPILEMQANHGVKVARQHYAIKKSLPKGVTEEEAEHFFYISKYWQYLWGYRKFTDVPMAPETKVALELSRILLKAEKTINLDPKNIPGSLEAPNLWQDKNLAQSLKKNTYELLLEKYYRK